MTDGPRCLLTASRGDDGSTVVAITGELDVEASADVREQLFELIAPGRTLVLDLGGLDFLDSSGLGVLVLALTKARAADGGLVVANSSPRVYRLMETSRLIDLFAMAGEPAAPAPPAERGSKLNPVREPAALEELRTLLAGFENLLRWGDLRPEQVTLALVGVDLADETTDLALAARVRRALGLLGAQPPPPPMDEV